MENKLLSLGGYLLNILLGILLIFSTEKLLISINYLFVSLFLIVGIISLLSFFLNKKKDNNTTLIIGMLLVWLSIFTYVYYSLFIIILPIISSLYAFIIATIMIIKYLKNKELSDLIIMIISLILGIILLFRPILSVLVYIKIIGVYLILITLILIIKSIISTKK